LKKEQLKREGKKMKHKQTQQGKLIYRVIQNDCRGVNNLPYTIHLR